MLLHHLKELDDDLGAGPDEDLALARLLGVVDGIERIVEDGSLDHVVGGRFSGRDVRLEVSVRRSISLQEPCQAWRVPFGAVCAARVLQLGRRGRRSVIAVEALSAVPWLPEGHLCRDINIPGVDEVVVVVS